MECVQNLLLGDPVYDERGQLVRREYGLKNALALFVLGYIAYTLYLSMGKKVFLGKRKGKMKWGGSEADSKPDSGSDDSAGMSKKDKVICVLYILLMIAWIYFIGWLGHWDWPPKGRDWLLYVVLGIVGLSGLAPIILGMKRKCKIWQSKSN